MTQTPERDISPTQKKVLLLCLICVVTLVAPFLFVDQANFNNDEAIYQLMAQRFAGSAELTIWNGFEERPSPELVLPQTLVYQGQLVPQYPHIATVIAAPFYALNGFAGLILLNALAFVATIGLCFLTARKMFRDTDLALNACLIFALATYAWEYSQAAWPHALSTFFIALSIYFTVTALAQPQGRSAIATACLGGIALGFGLGVRLDVAFALPAAVLPFLFVRPWRPWCIGTACVGLIPGLVVLGVLNHAKFGTGLPFAYGPAGSDGRSLTPAAYLPLVLAGTCVLACAWILSRPRGRAFAKAHRWSILAGFVILAGVAALTPALWTNIHKLADGVFQLIVDLRFRDLGYLHGGLSRGPGGAMVYLASVKKSLLQSCPYIVVLVIPILALLRGAKEGLFLSVLLLVPAGFVAAYGYFAWDGGTGLNLRYFVPILPFTSILAAFAWREMFTGANAARPQVPLIAGGAAAALYAAVIIFGPIILGQPWSIGQQEVLFLSLPLGIAVLALALLFAHIAKPSVFLRQATACSLAVALVWSSMVAFTYDFPRSHGLRKGRAALSQTLGQHIQPNSVVFSADPHLFYDLLIDQSTKIALPWRDGFEDFHSLIAYHHDRQRAVYVWITEYLDGQIRERSAFENYDIVPLYQNNWGQLVELIKPTAKNPG